MTNKDGDFNCHRSRLRTGNELFLSPRARGIGKGIIFLSKADSEGLITRRDEEIKTWRIDLFPTLLPLFIVVLIGLFLQKLV